MLRRLPVLLVALLLPALSARAQLTEDFADGELSLNPAWSGDLARWRVVRGGEGFTLQSAGSATSDTLHLSTPSATAFGRWSFTFQYEDVNLSNFNGSRIFLIADAADLTGDVHGYYLQLGANNNDQVGLYRMDGDAATKRVLLGRSESPLLSSASGRHSLAVERTPEGAWTVRVDGEEVLSASDGTYTESEYFGLWVKHTAAAANSYFFDDFRIEPAAGGTPPVVTDSLPPPILPGTLVINEILFAPASGEAEFVELYNRSGTALDLRSLTLRDASGRETRPPATALLPPGGYVVLASAEAPLDPAPPSLLLLTGWPALNNDGDSVVLRSGGVTVDSVAYLSSWGRPGTSIERIDPWGPSLLALNWAPSSHMGGGTPGTENSVYHRDTAGPSIVFAEQVSPVEIHVSFSEPPDPASLSAASFSVGGIRPVAAAPLDYLSWALQFTEPLPEGPSLIVTDVSDHTGNATSTATAPIAWLPGPGDLVINEIMYEPLAEPDDGRTDQPEYLEIFNRSQRRLSLNGLFLTGPADEHGLADTLHTGAPLALPPGGYAVIFAQGPDGHSADEWNLAQAFPDIDFTAPNVALLPVPRSTLSLNNDGDLVRLHRVGTILDQIDYSPDWHHPGLAQTKGIALERISPDLPPDAANWNSSPHSAGGTPGMPNRLHIPSGEPKAQAGLTIAPSPFSPDADGHDDHTLISYTLGDVGGTLRVRIFDSRGRLVRNLEPAGLAERSGQFIWDGRDDAGRDLRIGIYIVLLEAVFPALGKTEGFKEVVVLATRLD